MDIQSISNSNVTVQKPLSNATDTKLPVLPLATNAITSEAVSAATPTASLAQVSEAVKNINAALKSLAPDLQFSVDTDSKRTIVKVVDQETQEVIRQMPTAEALEIAKALDKVQGLLIRQKA